MSDVRSILIVEDEALIAVMTQAIVERLGYGVLGPAANVREALQILEGTRPDAALLDVSLAHESSFPIADVLQSDGVPFAFVTGQPELPARFAARPVLNKPYRADGLRRLVEDLVQPAGAR